ncbi:MAG: di-trans,poly-cis-decaprenylcistransferase [Rickettsiales bacterium]|nr:di-trans,poly-cis-decaprenylcistransferase [Rickettsiales bacterium]
MLDHLAIIMDGNGRWAEANRLPRTEGHRKGAEAAKQLVKAASAHGIKHLTLYTFSAENWNRPEDEVEDLMNLLRVTLEHEFDEIAENNIRFRVIGDRQSLPEDIRALIETCEDMTASHTGPGLNLALSYGSRQELLQAAVALANDIQNGICNPESLTEADLARHLYTAGIPDPDLLIRTGGDERLSNFLLWQSAYTELYFTPVLWPDFTPGHLEAAIAEFQSRERRFGTRPNQRKEAV